MRRRSKGKQHKLAVAPACGTRMSASCSGTPGPILLHNAYFKHYPCRCSLYMSLRWQDGYSAVACIQRILSIGLDAGQKV